MTQSVETDRKRLKAIRVVIGDLIEQNCKGCLTFIDNYKLFGQSQAQALCTSECNVGKQLFILGQSLLTGRTPKSVHEGKKADEPKKVNDNLEKELSKGTYLELSGSLPDYKIANQYNISAQTLKRMKDEWELPDKRLNPAKSANSNTEEPKRGPGRPKAKQVMKDDERVQTEQKTGVSKTDLQLEMAGKLSELEKTLRDKDKTILLLRAENERLQTVFQNQVGALKEKVIPTFNTFFQDYIQFTFKTKNATAADNVRRTLEEMGADLDYKVRSGVIVVTTDIDGMMAIE
ncbi:zinc-finger domain-containing protein [Brevibacillus panacihumi]|uniref:Zinc-finger domain-containing protein n=1 Tax=Brevibacillus panacihumi TaxID=497735 RepID=A0A3M8C972_9BACL|nr:zinc-finger domain-containing protein [Brevibacillus panacihumi]RNB72159.1 zinc-finger domain-containing protein [Brevibacillus panacihumi]